MASEPKDPVQDVSKPGSSPASATSRPLIIRHGGALQQDPMVATKSADDTESNPEEKQKVPSTNNKVIKPLSEDNDAPKTEEKPAKKADEKPESDEEAVVDALVDTVPDKKAVNEAEEAEQARAAHIEKLVDQKTYFLPINSIARRRHVRIANAFFILILLAVIVVIALADAELITLPFDLPFDVIPKQ